MIENVLTVFTLNYNVWGINMIPIESIDDENFLGGKVILLNAPPNTGKDYAASVISQYTGAKHMEFKKTLHNIAMAITGLEEEQYFKIYNDRDLKEMPHKLFLGKSPREMLIWISETVCKPEFGQDYFGKPAAAGCDPFLGTVFSDSGFPEEVFPIAEKVGAKNILVVRFTRNGATFGNDSRDYLQPEDCPKGVKFVDLTNDGDIDEFVSKILEEVKFG